MFGAASIASVKEHSNRRARDRVVLINSLRLS
jgi:hypothetical protein